MCNRVERFLDIPSTSSLIDGGVAAALSLTHIETPTGLGAVENGSLMGILNQQQIKTYAIFPAKLPYVPDTSKSDSAVTATPIVNQPNATLDTGSATPVPSNGTDMPPFTLTPIAETEQNGEGYLFGLLFGLGKLKK